MRKNRNIFWMWWLPGLGVAFLLSAGRLEIGYMLMLLMLLLFFPFYVRAKIKDGF